MTPSTDDEGFTTKYEYDKNRNRIKEKDVVGNIKEIQYDICDKMTDIIYNGKQEVSFSYYNNGLKKSVVNGSITQNYNYDAEGLCYEIQENDKLVTFIFNHDREVVSEKQDDILRSYIRESELLFGFAEHARSYYHYAGDEIGSINPISDGNRVLNSYSYDAWGEVVSERE